MSLPEVLLADTNVLVWMAADQERRLSKRGRQAFKAFEAGDLTLLVPSVVLLELWFLTLSGVLEAPSGVRAWWKGLQGPNLIELALEHEDVLNAAELSWAHRDPMDRLIVAAAQRMGVPLFTADGAIHEWGGVEVFW